MAAATIHVVPDAQMNLATILANMGSWLSSLGTSIVRESVLNVITVLLFPARPSRGAAPVEDAFPLTESETDYLFARVSDTIHAIIFGTVITAAVQGALGGLVFWLLGLPNPVFWDWSWRCWQSFPS